MGHRCNVLVSFGGITTAVLLELSIDLPQLALSALSVVTDHKLRTPGCHVPSDCQTVE